MSASANAFFEPHTGIGIVLDGGAVPVPRVHECGVMVLKRAWNYRDVCSPFWRAYYNRESGAAVRAGGKLLPLGPGRVVIIPEEARYDCVPHEGVRHLWIHFSLEGGRTAFPGGPWEIPLDPHTVRVWRRLYGEIEGARDGMARVLRHDCSAALIGALGRIEDEGLTAASPRLRRFLSWLERSLGNPPSLDEMAVRAGMGRRTFLRWFQRETGSTPVIFLTRLRIREACRLLRFGSDSIEQIADATGFGNRHHFTRVFSAQTGTGPSAFRKGF